MSAPTAPPSPRRAALVFIFVTVLLDILAMGMIIPVLPGIVEGFLNGDTARASEVFGLFSTVWALMQFVFSPVLGALSDRYGRRAVILVSNFGLGLDYILMALASSLHWLFVGRVISGITAASISTASAYIADVTPPEKRAASFGMIGAAFGVGFVLGPALGGVLGGVDPRMPFWVSAALSLANAMYGLFVLPESLPPERRKAFSWRRANPVGALNLLRSNREVQGLASVHFLYNLAHVALPSVFVLYGSYRFGWDQRTVGLTMAGVGLCSLFVQGGLVRPLVKKVGERRALLLGLSFGAVGFTIYGLAPTGHLFWLGVPVMSLWGLFGPASQGLMSSRISQSEQGQLQGALSSLMGIAGMIGPTIFTQTFAYFIGPRLDWNLPGAPFLFATLLLIFAIALAGRATRSRGEAAPVTSIPTAG
ncbi:TCR/Tet family MFS transporter [Vitiosangium sp. GDMCC 1.1324]|uniref:TCR/Tet family MFS transporter n=1 Tax=Vitiosangium sp. (strain GDMCC 1.1324) TaxID=2138576 RepID=UPI000D38D34E|nr:TCR/Tet family MFS transporter [Vitiosangium sp. GDMCC 1.1324]PTL77197.1 tetracycline resistance MFS efflux pump [Vitiosangium sp. GDMCC 1.1324]